MKMDWSERAPAKVGNSRRFCARRQPTGDKRRRRRYGEFFASKIYYQVGVAILEALDEYGGGTSPERLPKKVRLQLADDSRFRTCNIVRYIKVVLQDLEAGGLIRRHRGQVEWIQQRWLSEREFSRLGDALGD
jgi:hypothetical protein